MLSILLSSACLLLLVYFLSLLYFNGGINRQNEPVLIRGWIPYLGVVLEMGKKGFYGFVHECQQKYGNIFTLHLFGSRTHILTNYKDFQQIQKKHNVFSFYPLMDQFAINQENPIPSDEE
jgi:hypothetical protein